MGKAELVLVVGGGQTRLRGQAEGVHASALASANGVQSEREGARQEAPVGPVRAEVLIGTVKSIKWGVMTDLCFQKAFRL